MKTLNITDYKIFNPKLAKVMVSFTGDVKADEIVATLAEKLRFAAAPVRKSFRIVQAGVAVGFIRANKEVRVLEKGDRDQYKVMSSNILMDKEDETLWDVKSGAGGRYLARHGQEDLSELVEASIQRRSDIRGISHLTMAKAAPQELVAFVDDEGSMDYGFAVGTSSEKVKVVSYLRRHPMLVDYESVVSIMPVPVPKSVAAPVVASLTAEEKKDMVAYYTRLYSYDKAYLAEVIKNIEDGSLA